MTAIREEVVPKRWKSLAALVGIVPAMLSA
jgi:hypothetical protein